eukprot:CAMPEP_0178406322 /NCGR_PEP_ID=MMETSP0689_2-20121128/18852_1 /TAXON_ID=160604 /ORGANISM="Amphidinium massartii, Strain CS-259" /LENGTH=232 /DNA_ID=CAMNT_0020027359 /DNA_START=72 /DNA_END=770 /DNA_ORIENTATION=-
MDNAQMDLEVVQSHNSQASKGDLRYEIEVKTDWASLLSESASECTVEQLGDKEIWVVDGLFTEDECEALIRASEDHGYGATNYPKSYRGNLRLISTDKSLSELVWSRLRPYVPATLKHKGATWDAVGLNECWRLAKYYPSDRFCGHCDAHFERSGSEMSMLTVNIYMNGGFEGGSTRFYFADRSKPDVAIEPKPGRCLLFRQPPAASLYHDGEELRTGTKYLFRSDVMYLRR